MSHYHHPYLIKISCWELGRQEIKILSAHTWPYADKASLEENQFLKLLCRGMRPVYLVNGNITIAFIKHSEIEI